jgi:hypothetical protein
VQDHLQFAKKNFYIRGSRTMINETKTKELINSKNIQVHFFDKGIKNRLSAVRNIFLARLFLQFNKPYSTEGVKGCNMSFWKSDFIATNGYNNDIVGWGREDTEFAVRLINANVLKLHLKFAAVCYHLHHSFFSRDNDLKNIELLNKTIQEKIIYCNNGYTNVNQVEIYK